MKAIEALEMIAEGLNDGLVQPLIKLIHRGLMISQAVSVDLFQMPGLSPLVAIYAQSELPTEIEAEQIIQALEQRMVSYWQSSPHTNWQKPLANTVILNKLGEDRWQFRLISWNTGPTFWPDQGMALKPLLEHIYRPVGA